MRVTDNRGKRERAKPLAPDQIQAKYTLRLIGFARRLDAVCVAMETMGISTISPIPGGINSAIAKIDEVISREFEGKSRAAAAKKMHLLARLQDSQ